MQIYQPDTLLLVTRSGILRHTLPIAILKECATVNQDLKAIVLYMPELAEYVYVCLKGMESQLLIKYTKSGTTVENVNFDEFQKVLLPIAPFQEIRKIIEATSEATIVVSSIEDEKAALAEYRRAKKAAEDDIFVDTPSTIKFQNGIKVILLIGVVYWFVNLFLQMIRYWLGWP